MTKKNLTSHVNFHAPVVTRTVSGHRISLPHGQYYASREIGVRTNLVTIHDREDGPLCNVILPDFESANRFLVRFNNLPLSHWLG